MGRPRTNPLPNFVGGLPRYAYNNLQSRIASGRTVCELRHADVYRSVAHLLDEYGVVRRGHNATYSTAIRVGKSRTDETDRPVETMRVLYSRLADHRKKNSARRKVVLFQESQKGFSRDLDARCARTFGFTLTELIAHVEKLFEPGMSWARVIAGDIQLDHTIPVRVFDLSTQQGVFAAYALSNTVPLWRGDNARKGRTTDRDWLKLFGEGAIRG